ncbi:hypothetical protein V8C37DRAFT_383784 [Trichoderma ceciliae]
MTAPKPPPISALKALEPRPGGHWTVYEQEGDDLSLSYAMDNGTRAIKYTLRQCRTEEEIRKHCASFVYEYTDVTESGYNHQNVDEIPTEFRNTHEAAPQFYHVQTERSAGQYSTSQMHQPLQGHFRFSAQAAITSPSESSAQARVQFGETASAPPAQLYQGGQGYSMSNNQHLSQESFASGTAEWPPSDDFFSTAVGNAPVSIPGTEVVASQDATIHLDGWPQNWVHTNPNDVQNSDRDWDAFFSHN